MKKYLYSIYSMLLPFATTMSISTLPYTLEEHHADITVDDAIGKGAIYAFGTIPTKYKKQQKTNNHI